MGAMDRAVQGMAEQLPRHDRDASAHSNGHWEAYSVPVSESEATLGPAVLSILRVS